MTKDKRRLVAAALVDALIDAGHLGENEACRVGAVRIISGKLAEIERCGTLTAYPLARLRLADAIDETYARRQDGDK